MRVRDRGRALIGPVVLVATVLAIAWRVWTPIVGARRAFPWDAQWQYWGDLAFLIDSVRAGELPLWNPFDRCGYPFAADPQTGVLYPVNWLLVLVGLAGGATFTLVTIKILFHMTWWALGTYAWLRRRGTPVSACVAAGVFCTLSFPAHFWFSALNWSMAWLPWLLLGIDRWAVQPSTRTAAAVALGLAMCQLAGAPASFWYAMLVAIPYAAWSVAMARESISGRALVRSGALALVLFVSMVAGQTLATAKLVPHTVRAVRDLDFVASSGIRMSDLVGLVVPHAPGHEVYLGMVFVLAALAVLTVGPTPRNFLLLGLVVAGVLLSFGGSAPLLPSFASFAPVASLFRIAHRYMYVTILPLAALGAESLGALATNDDVAFGERARRLLFACGAAACVVFGVGIVTTTGDARDPWVWALVSWAFSAWILSHVAAPRARMRRVFATLAAVVFVADIWIARSPSIEEHWWALPSVEHDGEARALEGVPLEARIFDREYFKYRAGTRLHMRDLGGYEGDPLALSRYARLLDLVYAAPASLRVANVAYVTGGAGPRDMQLPPEMEVLRPGVVRVPDPAPAVAWYGRTRVVDSEAAAFDALRATLDDDHGARSVVVEGSGAAQPASLDAFARREPAPEPRAGRVIELARNRFVAEVDAPDDGVVVVRESFHPAWTATVDGKVANVFAADGAFRAVVVPAGHHRIEMRYRAGAAGSLMTIMPLAFALAIALARRR